VQAVAAAAVVKAAAAKVAVKVVREVVAKAGHAVREVKLITVLLLYKLNYNNYN